MEPLELGPGHLGRRLEEVEVGGVRLNRAVYAAGLGTPPHVHRLGNFCLTLGGSYEEQWAGRWHALDTERVLVKPPGVEHFDRFGARDATTCLNVEFSESAWERYVGNGFDEPCVMSDPRFQTIGRELELELTKDDHVSALAAEGLLLTLVAAVLRLQDEAQSDGSASWLDGVRERLRVEFAKGLHLDELAQEVGVHPSHLTRSFRKRFGCSVGDYVRRLRVAAVLRLLPDEDRTLAEIAVEAGFSDQSHMGRVLRKETGTTPAQWRARLARARRSARSRGIGPF